MWEILIGQTNLLRRGLGVKYTNIHTNSIQWRWSREMVKGCIFKVTKDNNDLLLNDGMSYICGQCILVRGNVRLDYNCITVLNVSDYVHVTPPINLTNGSKSRIIVAIALYPSGNTKGSWYFMLVATGERVHR